jgi:hypothetical protein
MHADSAVAFPPLLLLPPSVCITAAAAVCPLQPDLLQDLLAQLQAQHPGLEFPPIPDRGQLSVARVNSSRYFFS